MVVNRQNLTFACLYKKVYLALYSNQNQSNRVKYLPMKFCHIEESVGQQVLFQIYDESIYSIEQCVIIVTAYRDEQMLEKVIYEGAKPDAFAHFQTIDFPSEAYKFLTEIASTR